MIDRWKRLGDLERSLLGLGVFAFSMLLVLVS